MIQLKNSTDIHEYRDILEGFQSSFGEKHWWSILAYCNVISGRDNTFWTQYLIQNEENITVGVCGLFSMHPDSTEELWLGWFGILNEYRHMNYATEALFRIKEIALENGCKDLFLYTDAKTGPIDFYKKQGFAVIGTVKQFLEMRQESLSTSSEFRDPTDIVMHLQLQNKE